MSQDLQITRELPPKYSILRGPEPLKPFIVEGKEENPPSLYLNAVCVDIVNNRWELTSDTVGLKCFILPKSRDKLLTSVNHQPEKLRIISLRVINYSEKSLTVLCEAIEYGQER